MEVNHTTRTPESALVDHSHELQKKGKEQQLVTEDFLKQLAKELDVIFSRDFLINDPLYNVLDIDSFIPLQTIADLAQIKALTKDVEVVKKAFPFTSNIVVDEQREMLKPTFKVSQRNTIVLRDIPNDVPHEEIRALFAEKPEILDFLEEMKAEVGSTFFLRFRDEQAALGALSYVKTRQFREKPVGGFIKAENLARSFYYTDPSVQPLQPGINPYLPSPSYNRPYNGRNRNNYHNNNYNNQMGERSNYHSNYQNNANSHPHNSHYHNNSGSSNYNKRANHGEQGAFHQGGFQSKPGQGAAPHKNTLSPISTSFWPPLASENAGGEIPSGYQGDYKKYTKEQIVAVLSSVKDKIEKEPPAWEKRAADVIVDQPLLYSEILKTVPKDAKVEFVDVSRNPSSAYQQHQSTAKPVPAPKVDYKNKALRGVASQQEQAPAPHKPAQPGGSTGNKWRHDTPSDGKPEHVSAGSTFHGGSGANSASSSSGSSNFVPQNRSANRNRQKKNSQNNNASAGGPAGKSGSLSSHVNNSAQSPSVAPTESHEPTHVEGAAETS